MKISLYLLFSFIGLLGFSQSLDSLTITYSIGYDCTVTIESEEFRGACGRSETIEYNNKKKKYVAKKRVYKEVFRKRGLDQNLIADSVKTHRLPVKRNLSSGTLNKLLKQVCGIQSDSIFAYKLKDVPKSFIENNKLNSKELKATEIDALLKDVFQSFRYSTVTGYFTISFQLESKQYKLWKDSNNPYWSFQSEEMESDESIPIHFVCFELDAFLLKNLPKKLLGIHVLK